MTNAEKFVKLIKKEFGCDGSRTFIHFLESHPCYAWKCPGSNCNGCEHHRFWLKEADANECEAES